MSNIWVMPSFVPRIPTDTLESPFFLDNTIFDGAIAFFYAELTISAQTAGLPSELILLKEEFKLICFGDRNST
ncbi:MAG: hypothetical protein SAQ54_12605 [Oscillatoria sp. PMC 1050.18]|nr:hypothetical protein [Oscillatoria sp. PMC 1050.18]